MTDDEIWDAVEAIQDSLPPEPLQRYNFISRPNRHGTPHGVYVRTDEYREWQRLSRNADKRMKLLFSKLSDFHRDAPR